MDTNKFIIPGIRRIGVIDCDKLPRHVDLSAICLIPVPVLCDITDIDFFGEPEGSRSTERQGNGNIDTASLKFHCSAMMPFYNHLGFVVTDNNGDTWLIGSKEPPYPVVKAEFGIGTAEGDTAGVVYEVQHKAIKTLIKCHI